MADEHKPSNPTDVYYRPGLLNRWFMIGSVALAITYVWSVVADFQRPWKKYQRQWLDLEFVTAAQNRDEEWQQLGGKSVTKELEELKAERERRASELAADHHVRPELEEAVRQATYQFNVANAAMKAAKADFEAARFHYEELVHHENEPLLDPKKPKVVEEFRQYNALKQRFLRLEEANKEAAAAKKRAEQELEKYNSQVLLKQEAIDAIEREMDRLERTMLRTDTERWFTKFRNTVFFDFMQPNIKVRKIVVPEIKDDLNFLQVPKVDMCVTCHLASDRYKDYPYGDEMFALNGDDAGVNPVFQAHPRPELFATSLSPHPQGRFGCSGCHSGGNQRVDFVMAAHTPSNPAEKEAWKTEYDWKKAKYWDYPQLPAEFLEASCYKCHKQQTEILGAEQWNHGRELVESYGCYGCHKMAPFEDRRKPGPPLYNMPDKFVSVDWTLNWVDRPRDFRPQTTMPQFFHLPNRPNEARQRAEITALVTYLYDLTEPVDLKQYPGNGDAEEGKKLFGENGGIGCMACHNIDDYSAPEELGDRHGPDLSGAGSKLDSDWIYTWLLNPQEIWAETNMPNLRLTNQEAADLTAYLLTKRNTEFENKVFERPAGDSHYEEIVREKLKEQMTEARANELIAAMSSRQKRLQAGEALLNHYGCFGCHNVAGYEDAKQIGTELNSWGSKHADRLDFGVFALDWKHDGRFNRISWLERKLRNTRFFDEGKDKSPFEKLKMPQFRFPENPEDLEAVMTFVLGFADDPLDESIKKNLSAAEKAVERGKQLVQDKNCMGCHRIYKEGGEIRAFQLAARDGNEDEARSFYPPELDGQGARTQHDWLFSFLQDPSMGGGRGSRAHLRPWMQARMPDFHFSQQELNDLVAYFAHEEVWHTSEDRELWAELEAEFRDNFDGYDPKDLRVGSAAKYQLFQELLARNYQSRGGDFLHQTDFPYLEEVERTMDAERAVLAREFFEEPLNCIQCHMPGGIIPEGKTAADMAPSLDLTKNRLQPDWVLNWFKGPAKYQPGTRMPNFWPLEADGDRQSNHEEINDAEREMDLIRDYLFSTGFASDYEEMAR